MKNNQDKLLIEAFEKWLHRDCDRETPSVVGFKVIGLKNKFKIYEIDYYNKEIKIELIKAKEGQTYCEEDLNL